MTTRIALVHAVVVAMEPVADAFARHWPEAELVNLLADQDVRATLFSTSPAEALRTWQKDISNPADDRLTTAGHYRSVERSLPRTAGHA